jgi:hypothetical protein
MDADRFDALARRLGAGSTRRALLRALGAVALVAWLSAPAAPAGAAKPDGTKCKRNPVARGCTVETEQCETVRCPEAEDGFCALTVGGTGASPSATTAGSATPA